MNFATHDFDVVLVDTCATASLSIDPTILSSTSLIYNIREAMLVETMDPNLVIASPPPLTPCPPTEFAFDDQTGSPIDPSAFSYDIASSEFRIYSTDYGIAAIYPLRLTVKYQGMVNTDELLFTATLVACE